MPGENEDEYEYTISDVTPREPDKFEKSNDSRESDDTRDRDGRGKPEHK